MSSSISCWARRRWLNSSALALFHLENRISVAGRLLGGFGFRFGLGFGGGEKMGNGMINFSAITCLVSCKPKKSISKAYTFKFVK